jgi:TonB family protein
MKAFILVVIVVAACSKTDKSDLALPSPTIVVKPDALVRISGDAAIQPDAETAKTMVATGHAHVITSWKLCVDPTGTPDEVSVIHSSGFVTWDTALAAGMHAWRFEPVTNDGAAVRACTSYTFAWSNT